MSDGSAPGDILDALARAEVAFEDGGFSIPVVEAGIEKGGGWKTQLTKACRLLEVVDVLHEQDGYYTAVIELCFGAIERSIEAYAVSVNANEVDDFKDHEYCYERADHLGLFDRDTAMGMMSLYNENRTESYYGGGRPTEPQAEAMTDLARGCIHSWFPRSGKVECVLAQNSQYSRT